MIREEVLSKIQTVLDQILDAKGIERVALADDVALLNGAIPIDSLDLAQIVVELQNATGIDPFETGFIEFRTAGELASLFTEDA
jgi:acyl carrier protein